MLLEQSIPWKLGWSNGCLQEWQRFILWVSLCVDFIDGTGRWHTPVEAWGRKYGWGSRRDKIEGLSVASYSSKRKYIPTPRREDRSNCKNHHRRRVVGFVESHKRTLPGSSLGRSQKQSISTWSNLWPPIAILVCGRTRPKQHIVTAYIGKLLVLDIMLGRFCCKISLPP